MHSGRRLGPASAKRDGNVKLLSGTKETSVFLLVLEIQSSLLWFLSLDLQVDSVS